MTRRYAHLEKAKTAKLMGNILSNLGGKKPDVRSHLLTAPTDERFKTWANSFWDKP
jgi:hypothetical protein